VLVLLPPSETKAPGGDGPAFSLDALSFRSLDPTRKQLMDELVSLAGDPVAARLALGLSPRQDAETVLNAGLWTAPTTPALHRYTGVLYDALDARSLRGAAAARAWQRFAVGSALFGLLTASDPVPAYRLSAGSVLPGANGPGPTLGARWRPVLEPLLAGLHDEHGLMVDLRSGSYAALGRAPGAVTVRVLTEHPDGARSVISHHNKAHKGRLARLLGTTRAEPTDVNALLRLLRRAGLRVEHPAPLELDLLT
jgi:cytoplasmic iron level regulating protein YaaA (DUF328/UPF0246 family)